MPERAEVPRLLAGECHKIKLPFLPECELKRRPAGCARRARSIPQKA
jgi:hypothetical protein